jgi:twitching motility protein PilT
MVTSLFHDILSLGVNEGASDWHIRENRPVGLRVNGTLVEIDFVPDTEFLHKAVAQIVKPLLMDAYERTGDADFAFEEEGVGRFRANLHRQRGMMSLSLRHVKSKVPPLEELGLPPIVHQIAQRHRGIVFVTGTTGSGKSTTLACMIEYMNAQMNRHIVSIEDPIEYSFEDKHCIIEQREVGLDTESFRSALIHVLRQDPDVIVIGEMRNRETFETALTAAETGHLVLTTLHTMNAGQSIMRILDFYSQDERDAVRNSLASALQAIICQRLVPRASGKGVVPAVEILINTPIVTKLLSEDRINRLDAAINAGTEEGMMSFNHCLLELANSGTITEDAALDFSNNREALQMNLRGIFLSDDGGIIGE